MKNFLKKSAAYIYVYIIFPVICVSGLYGAMVLAEIICQKI